MISQIITKLNEGGPAFMYTILIVLILIIILIVKAFLESPKNKKTLSLIASLGWFVLVFGIMGQTIGLIGAFDSIQAAGDISMSLVAGGLKVSLLTTVFGLFSFLIARLGIIILVSLKKEEMI